MSFSSHRRSPLAAIVAVAAVAALLPVASASAYTVPADESAGTGYIGFHSDGSSSPDYWQPAEPGAVAGTATAGDSASTPRVASANAVNPRFTTGYIGAVDGRIPEFWRAPESAPATTDTAPPAPRVEAPSAPAPSAAPDVTPVVADDGAPVLPWIIATIVFALLTAAAGARALVLHRRSAPARVAARV